MSSSRIKFQVIYCSTFADGYAPQALETQSHNTRGWQSARFCEYPQELVLLFDQIYEVNQFQVLSHQLKIASSIELHAGIGRDGQYTNRLADATFELLGCVKCFFLRRFSGLFDSIRSFGLYCAAACRWTRTSAVSTRRAS